MDDACRVILVNQSATFSSRLFFRGGQFVSNKGQVLLVTGILHIKKLNFSMIGPIIIKKNWSVIKYFNDLILIQNMVVYIHGPVHITQLCCKTIAFYCL